MEDERAVRPVTVKTDGSTTSEDCGTIRSPSGHRSGSRIITYG
jgi:hypothetical protein